MTNKKIIQSIFPKAKAEVHYTGFPKRKYYLIRNDFEYMYLAEGETEAKAWKNALPVVLERVRKAVK